MFLGVDSFQKPAVFFPGFRRVSGNKEGKAPWNVGKSVGANFAFLNPTVAGPELTS